MGTRKTDTRWNGIPLWKDASLDLAMIWGLPSNTDAQKDIANNTYNDKGEKINPSETDLSSNSGVILMAEYTQGNFFGGFNKLSVTYGTDGFAPEFNSSASKKTACNPYSIRTSAQ